MQRMDGMSIVGCCVPEGSSAEALNQVWKPNISVYVSIGREETEARGYSGCSR